MAESNSREVKVRAFFDKPHGSRAYLEKRFGVNVRAFIAQKLLGEVANARILDVGCGDGTLSFQFATRENRLTLIDFSEKMLETARQNAPVGWAEYINYHNLDFFEYVSDQAFDVVLCIGVLAHVKSLDFALAKLYSLLKPGGSCLIQFTDHNSWIAKINVLGYSLSKTLYGSRYQYALQKLSYPEVICSCIRSNFSVAGECRYSILLPGMGRLPDKFLYLHQLFVLKNAWLSQFGSEVVIRLVKP